MLRLVQSILSKIVSPSASMAMGILAFLCDDRTILQMVLFSQKNVRFVSFR